MSDTAFTLDLGENFIKMADVKISNNIIEVKNLNYIELPFPFFTADLPNSLPSLSEIIKKLTIDGKISKKNVNVIIPDAFTYSQIVEMPRLNEKELISAIKYQADQFIPMPIEETNIDLEIVLDKEVEKKLLVLIVAAPKKLIEKIENGVEAAGLLPQSLENEFSASSRFISQFMPILFPNNKEGVLIVNLGINSTSLYFFQPKISIISRIHTFNLGCNLFIKEIQITTSVDQKKSAEILKSFDPKQTSTVPVENIISPLIKEFIFELKKIERAADILVMGEIFRFPALTQIIEKSLGISTQVLTPYPFLKSTPAVEQYKSDLPFFIAAFGGEMR